MSRRAPKSVCAVSFAISRTWTACTPKCRLRLTRLYQPALEPFVSADWRGKLGEMIVRRTNIYEQLLPFKRAADAHRHESPSIQANHKATTQMLRDRLAHILPPTIAGNPQAFEAIDLLLSIDCWQRLRIEQQLDAAMARRLIDSQIGLIVGDA